MFRQSILLLIALLTPLLASESDVVIVVRRPAPEPPAVGPGP